MTKVQAVTVDERGRVTLGQNNVRPGNYLMEVGKDGVIMLHPAVLVTEAQLKLFNRPEVMSEIDEFHPKAVKPSDRGRPRRSEQ